MLTFRDLITVSYDKDRLLALFPSDESYTPEDHVSGTVYLIPATFDTTNPDFSAVTPVGRLTANDKGTAVRFSRLPGAKGLKTDVLSSKAVKLVKDSEIAQLLEEGFLSVDLAGQYAVSAAIQSLPRKERTEDRITAIQEEALVKLDDLAAKRQSQLAGLFGKTSTKRLKGSKDKELADNNASNPPTVEVEATEVTAE